MKENHAHIQELQHISHHWWHCQESWLLYAAVSHVDFANLALHGVLWKNTPRLQWIQYFFMHAAINCSANTSLPFALATCWFLLKVLHCLTNIYCSVPSVPVLHPHLIILHHVSSYTLHLAILTSPLFLNANNKSWLFCVVHNYLTLFHWCDNSFFLFLLPALKLLLMAYFLHIWLTRFSKLSKIKIQSSEQKWTANVLR